jgi:hypothetical protein
MAWKTPKSLPDYAASHPPDYAASHPIRDVSLIILLEILIPE